MNEELVRLMMNNNMFDARNKRKPGSKEPNRLDEERNSGGIDSEGHNTYSEPPNRVLESMHPVEQLHFLSLISLSIAHSIRIPRFIERLMLREVLHLLLLLRPRRVQPVLHLLRDRLQARRLLAHDLR